MDGFILSFFINLLCRLELLVLAVIAFLLHVFFDFPIVIAYVLLGMWILSALIITLGLGVLTRNTPPPKYQKNVNPYSKKTEDFMAKDESNNDGEG